MNQPETIVRHSPEFSRSGDTDIVSDPAARSTVAAHGVLDMSKTPRVEKVMTCQCHDSSHAGWIFWRCPSKGRMTPHHFTTLSVADDPQPFSCLRSNPQNVTAVEVLARSAVVCFSRIYSVYIYILIYIYVNIYILIYIYIYIYIYIWAAVKINCWCLVGKYRLWIFWAYRFTVFYSNQH